MKKYLWPIGGVVVTILAGVVVMVAPFALHLNHGSHWALATKALFWQGLGVIAVGMLALIAWQRDLGAQLRRLVPPPADGAVERAEGKESAPSPTINESSADDWERELAKLAEAVLQDLKSQTDTSLMESQSPVPDDDLKEAASALLHDLSHRMERVGVNGGRQGGRYS